MSTNILYRGWSEDDFLSEDFASGGAAELEGAQVQLVINKQTPKGMQAELFLADALTLTGMQAEAQVRDWRQVLGVQAEGMILDYVRAVGQQVEAQVGNSLMVLGAQLATSNILYQLIGGFLVDDFLTGPFLGRKIQGRAGMQTHLQVLDFENARGMQAEGQIVNQEKDVGLQVEMQVVDWEKATGMQAVVIQAVALGCQVRFILYNTDKPRILAEFPSRGLDGENWTSSSTEPGDFSPYNLNNDVVEFYWRSETGVKSGITLTCDAQQAVAADTLALLEHNLTKSATVVFQGSNASDFSTVGFTTTLTPMIRNSFWVAPTLPQDSYRYWRFLISDNTNPDNYIKIGTIVFGQAVIFQGETAEQHVKLRRTHFKQENPTEGHTSVSQDLALKKAITVNFPNLDAQHSGNYDALVDVFEFARTSLKCLWMVDPRPLYIEKFTVFGKIVQLPDEDHNVITSDEFRVSLSVEVDEAK